MSSVRDNPTLSRFELTAEGATALAYYRLADKQQSVNYIQYMDLNLLTEGQRAVFAAIAAANGFRSEALGVVKAINPQVRMFPEERSLYNRVFN